MTPPMSDYEIEALLKQVSDLHANLSTVERERDEAREKNYEWAKDATLQGALEQLESAQARVRELEVALAQLLEWLDIPDYVRVADNEAANAAIEAAQALLSSHPKATEG